MSFKADAVSDPRLLFTVLHYLKNTVTILLAKHENCILYHEVLRCFQATTYMKIFILRLHKLKLQFNCATPASLHVFKKIT
jgi:hypothetical protein